MIFPLPQTDHKKALFIIDVQPGTFKGDKPFEVASKLPDFIRRFDYDAYIVAEYYAPPESMLAVQHGHQISREDAGETCPKVRKAVNLKSAPAMTILKTTRSCFKCFDKESLFAFLDKNHIKEIHLAGFDADDCVLATTYDANDLGYLVFVIEELTHRWNGDQDW